MRKVNQSPANMMKKKLITDSNMPILLLTCIACRQFGQIISTYTLIRHDIIHEITLFLQTLHKIRQISLQTGLTFSYCNVNCAVNGPSAVLEGIQMTSVKHAIWNIRD